MGKQNYTQVQVLMPEIKATLVAGKTQQKVAVLSKYVVKHLLIRERRKERKLEAGILPRWKGRPRKDSVSKDIVAEQAGEIQPLRMENQLCCGIFCNLSKGSGGKSQIPCDI